MVCNSIGASEVAPVRVMLATNVQEYPRRFVGQSVIITAATAGIGLSIAHRLGRREQGLQSAHVDKCSPLSLISEVSVLVLGLF